MNPAGHWETHDAGVVNDDHDNRECSKKIETWLAFAILKAGSTAAAVSDGLRVTSDESDTGHQEMRK
jgi:hypothetical protein